MNIKTRSHASPMFSLSPSIVLMFEHLFVPRAISHCTRANNGNQSNEQSIRDTAPHQSATRDTGIGGTSATFTAVSSDSPIVTEQKWNCLTYDTLNKSRFGGNFCHT